MIDEINSLIFKHGKLLPRAYFNILLRSWLITNQLSLFLIGLQFNPYSLIIELFN